MASSTNTACWTRRSAVVAVAAAALATGCPTAHTLQPARALGVGNGQVEVELGAQALPVRSAYLEPLRGNFVTETTGHVDLSFRHGLAPRTDGFLRFGTSGLELGLKQELAARGWFAVGAAGSLRGRLDVVEGNYGGMPEHFENELLDGIASLILEMRPWDALALIVAPKAIGSLLLGQTPPTCAQPPCAGGGNPARFDYGITAGAMLRFGPHFVLMPELALLRPLRAASWIDEHRPAITATLAIGWTGQTLWPSED
jgi:hypothetical protein